MVASNFRVVMLVDSGELSKIVYNGIKDDFNVVRVFVEEDASSADLVRKRIKRLGVLKTVGQVMFVAFNKLILYLSMPRIEAIKRRHRLSSADYPEHISTVVKSVNDGEVIEFLREIRPDAVVVNGTRIISEQVLAATDAVFLNTHVGITPRYRGVHGAYWALVHSDHANCGVTVHLVDSGIDTGGVLYQDTIRISRFDNLNTYPFRQIAKAIPLMKKALEDVSNGSVRVKRGVEPSRLWSHPTLFEYLKFRLWYGVK